MSNDQIVDPLRSRKMLDHRGPLSIDVSNAIYFITIAASERGGTALSDHASAILRSARYYQSAGKWFLYLFLVMPDHLHMLVHVPTTLVLADVISSWKHYLAHAEGVAFQRDFFDTRIRDEKHFQAKWNYICRNPVARGLVKSPRDWPHIIAFDPKTGVEREHR